MTADNLDEYRMLDEWMIEFLGEGRRRTDLIRWDKFVTESWWDHTPLNDKKAETCPIPNSAISANNLIEQNPGYSIPAIPGDPACPAGPGARYGILKNRKNDKNASNICWSSCWPPASWLAARTKPVASRKTNRYLMYFIIFSVF